MTISRRTFLSGLLAAPAIITTPGLLMPTVPVYGRLDRFRYIESPNIDEGLSGIRILQAMRESERVLWTDRHWHLSTRVALFEWDPAPTTKTFKPWRPLQ